MKPNSSSARKKIYSASQTFSSNVSQQCPVYQHWTLRLITIVDLRELPDAVFPLPHPERVKHTKERGQLTPPY